MNRHRRRIYALLAVLTLVFLSAGVFVWSRYSADVITTPPPPKVYWDGEGGDSNWSTAANWSKNQVPSASDDASFDSRNKTDAIIDPAFAGTVHSITIGYGYTGKIIQQRSLEVIHNFNQDGGTFDSDPSKTFTVGGSFYLADNQISDGEVNVIKSDGDGNTYVGGTFTTVSNLPVKYLAKWDGNRWSNLGASLNGPVKTIAIDSANNIYAGGTFTKAGDLLVNGIAKWNALTSVWNALDGGMTEGYDAGKVSAEVKIIAIDNQDKVYAGGTFENAGSLLYANHLARWNGTAWEKFGSGLGGLPLSDHLSGYVSQIIVKDNTTSGATDKDIYIGGDFNNICGNDLCTSGNTAGKFLAKYDGNSKTWAQYASVPGGPVKSMTFDSSNNFYFAGNDRDVNTGADSTNHYVSKWDGAAKTGMGSFSGAVNSIVTIGPEIYIGGGVTPNAWNYLMRWNGSVFDRFPGTVNESSGRGVNGAVNTLEVIDGRISIGGAFSAICYNGSPCKRDTTFQSASGLAVYDPTAKTTTRLLNPAAFNRFAGGDGLSATTPYLIQDIYGLESVLTKDSLWPCAAPYVGNGYKEVPSKSVYFALKNDVEAISTAGWNGSSNFLPLSSEKKTFWGDFNGNSHIISRLKISNFSHNAGLFGVLERKSAVRNLALSDANLSSEIFENNAGILAGKNLGTISGVTVSGTINISSPSGKQGQSVGGVVGFSSNYDYGSGDVPVTSISGASSNVAITGTNISDVGGILGTQEKIPVKRTSSYKGTNFYYKVGSTIKVTLSDLHATGGSIDLTNTSGRVGGLIGRQDYENAVVTGSFSASTIRLTMSDKGALVDGSVGNIGGLIGYSFGSIVDSSATGTVTVPPTPGSDIDISNVGGLVGKADTPDNDATIISGSHSSGAVNITQRNGSVVGVGGLAGETTIGKIDNSFSDGAVTINSGGGVKFVGGLIGYGHDSDISLSHATGAINVVNSTASGQYATGSFGGLGGFLSRLNVVDSDASGNVNITADDSCNTGMGGVGGLVGVYSADLSNKDKIDGLSSATGSVTANCANKGAKIGWPQTTIVRKIGDINDDSVVDIKDFTALLFNWGTPTNPRADISPVPPDGVVDIQDFTVLLSNWST